MKKHRVIFQPSGRRGEVQDGANLLDAARNLGVDIESICGGKGTCGKCKVRVEEGFFEKDSMDSRMAHLSPLTDSESKFLKPSDGPAMRLACACRVEGDVKIFVPEKSRAGKQIVRKEARELAISIDPAVKKYFVELAKPSLREPIAGDLERLRDTLEKQYGLKGLSMDFIALKDLQDVIRKGNWSLTVSVWKGREIIKAEPGFVDTAYGLAVDVGTTTVVGYLTDLATGKVVNTASMMNPQVPYGEDVMSRITYAMMNPGGIYKMQKAIIDGLNEIISNVTRGLSADGSGEGGEAIVDLTIVFNTAMHHIFLGFYPEYIGRSPFVPAIQNDLDIKARDLGIRINPGSYIFVLPIEAGFVGADNVGVLIAEEPYNQAENVLLIDIGTNGELLLGNKDKVCSTSCATGPAFEGAQIKMGMRAAPGAIEKVRINPETKEPLYKIIGEEDWHAADWNRQKEKLGAKGICGSGIIDAIAEMFKAGIIDKSGKFDMRVSSPRVRRDHDGKPEYVLAWSKETSIGADVTITQADVRALQLAKAALYAGAKLMMQKMGIEKLDRVVLAGAFGSYIDKESAMALGMFPDCRIENVYAVGNAAGDGARMALVNMDKRLAATVRARWVEYVEIAVEPRFEKEFTYAMHLPHMKDGFPHLKDLLEKCKCPSAVVIKG